MSTITLVKTIIALCDGGQCGGEITLVTDGCTEAYAVVQPAQSAPFIAQDCPDIERREADGTIVIQCGAVNPDAEETCTGIATVTRADLADVVYAADTAAAFMHPMEGSL